MDIKVNIDGLGGSVIFNFVTMTVRYECDPHETVWQINRDHNGQWWTKCIRSYQNMYHSAYQWKLLKERFYEKYDEIYDEYIIEEILLRREV